MPVINRIREERLAQQLTQQELADRAHCSRMSIVFLESGRMEAGGELMLKIAQALDKPVEHLFVVTDQTQWQALARSAKVLTREISLQIVLLLVSILLFFQGGAIAADRISPVAAAGMRQISALITHPDRSLSEARALDISPVKFLTASADAVQAPRRMTSLACAAWLSQYGQLAQYPDPNDPFGSLVLQQAAICFDIVGLSADAVAAHEGYVALTSFAPSWAFGNVADLRVTHALRVYLEATKALRLGDTRAASELARQSVNDDAVVLYLIALRHAQSLPAAHDDLATLLPANEISAEVHLMRGMRALSGRDLVVAQREGRAATQQWPGIIASTESWTSLTDWARNMKADALVVLNHQATSQP